MALFVWPPQNINTTGLATEAKQDTLIAAVDGVETLITATNTKIDTIDGHIDDVETLITSTNTKLDGIDQSLISIAATDFATETTQQKLRKWPYATFDAQVLTPALSSDTWQYKTGGSSGTVVGTILISYTDSTKAVIASITYNPVKAV